MKKSEVFRRILFVTAMFFLIIIFLTDRSYAYAPASSQTEINPKPEDIYYTNEILPGYAFLSRENSFDQFKLTEFASLDVTRYGVAGTNQMIWNVKSSGEQDNWRAYFSIGFDNMQDQVKKGDLEIMVVFDAQNKKRSAFYEDDYVNFQLWQNLTDWFPACSKYMWGDSSPELMHNGWKENISTGWIPVKKSAVSIGLRFFSTNGEKSNNDTAVQNIRVFFKDKNGPVAKAIEAVSGTYKDHLDFKLVFDEAVKLNGTPGSIQIVDGSGKNVTIAEYDGIDETDNRKLKYHFDVPKAMETRGLNANIPGIFTGGGAHPFSAVTDTAGNYYAGTRVGASASSASSNNGLLSVSIDNLPPKIKNIDVPNTLPALKQGSRVTVNVEFSERIYWNTNVMTSLAMNTGGSAGGTTLDARVLPGNILQLDYIVGADDNEAEKLDIKTNKQSDGSWTAELIGDIKDMAGNQVVDVDPGTGVIDISVPVSDPVTGKATTCQARVDKTSPYVNVTLNNTDWAKTQTVTVSVSDRGIDTFRYRIWGSTSYKVLSINGVLQDSSQYKFCEFSTLPAGENIEIEFETSSGGEFGLQIDAWDNAGNYTILLSDKMKFDKIAPAVSFIHFEDDPGKIQVSIADNEVGFDLSETEMAWADFGNYPDENDWTQIDPEGGEYAAGSSYTSQVYTMSAVDGELNRKRLLIRSVDLCGNQAVVGSQLMIKDLTYPKYSMFMPSTEQYSPWFYCWAYGDGDSTVAGTVYTELTYKWVKPEIDPETMAWVFDDEVPVGDSSELYIEQKNYLSRPSAQRYFNDGELFNGPWLLYLKAVYSENTENPSYLGPFKYNFDNTLTSVIIDGGDDTASREKSINVDITKIYTNKNGEEEEFSDIPVTGTRYYWTYGGQFMKPEDYGETFGYIDVTEKNFTVDAIDMPDTGLYNFNIVVSNNNPDDYKTVSKELYFDYHTPRGYMDISRSANKLIGIDFTISALDLTAGSNGSLEYSISVDEGEWSPWVTMNVIKDYYGNGVQPTQEELDKVSSSHASLYSSHLFPGILELSNSIEGPHTVSMKLRDAAGNESDAYNYVVYYDNTKPAGTVKYSTIDSTNQNVIATLDTVKDNISLSEDIQAYNDLYKTWVPWNEWSYTFMDNGEYNVRVKDLAGNETEITAKVDWIDKNKPVMDASQYPDPYYGKVEYYGKYLVVDVVPYDIINEKKIPLKLYYCLRRYDTKPAEYNPEDPGNVWKEAVEILSPAEDVVIKEIDGVTHYLLKLYNYNQDDSDQVGAEGKRHILYLKAVDEAGNITYDFNNNLGYVNNYIDYRFLTDQDIYANAVYTPIGVDDYIDPIKTAGPVKTELEFDTPVVIVPMEGEYSLPVSLNEYKTSHVVYVTENGLTPLKVVNRFGKEVIVPHSIYVNGIDNSLKPKVTYSPEGWTNESSVTVTVEAGDDQLIYGCLNTSGISEFIGSEGAETFELEGRNITGYKKVNYRFKENGTLNYMVYNSQADSYGSGQAVVDRIDRIAPAAQIAYDSSSLYDENGEISNTGYVKANLYNISDNSNAQNSVSIINEGGATHVFTENGSFDFVIRDLAGNTATLTAIVNSINRTPPLEDTTPPTADVSFWIKTVGGPDSYDPVDWSNTNVHAVIAPKDESPVTITNNDGKNEYIFTESGSFTFNLEDSKGNTADIKVTVDKIDKSPPQGYIKYVQDITYQDVTATLLVSDDNGIVNIMNTSGIDGKDAEGNPYHVFSSSGSFVFYVQDIARNTAGFKAETNGIDRNNPNCTVSGVPAAFVNKDVRVTIAADELIGDAVIMGGPIPNVSISHNGNHAYALFAQNASVTVRISDIKGNYTDVPITVDKIDKVPPEADLQIDDSKKLTEGIVTVKLTNLRDNVSTGDNIKVLNNYGSIVKTFGSDCTYSFVIADEAGNETELPVTITGIDKTPPELSLSYSTVERTKGPVTVTLSYKDASAVTILNNYGSPTAVFTQNGAFTFLVQDASGNIASIIARVENIDNKAPTITFDNTDSWLVFVQNGELKLDDYKAFDDIDGDVTGKVSINYNGFDISKPGDYNILYTVSDSVGNISQAERKVKVVSKDSLRIFVNGQDAMGKTVITNGPSINMQIMNAKGDIAAWWKKGKLPKGMMKSGSNKVMGSSFHADALGWYTILVQDQERNSYLIYIYVSSMSN